MILPPALPIITPLVFPVSIATPVLPSALMSMVCAPKLTIRLSAPTVMQGFGPVAEATISADKTKFAVMVPGQPVCAATGAGNSARTKSPSAPSSSDENARGEEWLRAKQRRFPRITFTSFFWKGQQLPQMVYYPCSNIHTVTLLASYFLTNRYVVREKTRT
jgi:hypothetical protein